MSRKQFVALFACTLAPYVVGSGALPLLPVYASKLGAPPVVTGYYLAFYYLAVTAGALLSGWLSDRFGRRRMRIGGVIGFAGMGHAVQRLGLANALIGSAMLPLIAIALVAAIRQASMAAIVTDRGTN